MSKTKTDSMIDKAQIIEWTREVLEGMGEWTDEINDNNEHSLLIDLEFIDVHARKLAAQVSWVGQVVAHLKALEEKMIVDLDALEGKIASSGKFGNVTLVKAAVKSDPDFVKKSKEVIDVKTQRRCAEALQEAIKAKERMMPGCQGAANILRKMGGENYDR